MERPRKRQQNDCGLKQLLKIIDVRNANSFLLAVSFSARKILSNTKKRCSFESIEIIVICLNKNYCLLNVNSNNSTWMTYNLRFAIFKLHFSATRTQ